MTMDMQTYRDGRRRAEEAAEAIRDALTSLGLPESVGGGVRPMVTHSGKPYVHLGMVRADVAARMAEAMRAPAEAVEQGRPALLPVVRRRHGRHPGWAARATGAGLRCGAAPVNLTRP